MLSLSIWILIQIILILLAIFLYCKSCFKILLNSLIWYITVLKPSIFNSDANSQSKKHKQCLPKENQISINNNWLHIQYYYCHINWLTCLFISHLLKLAAPNCHLISNQNEVNDLIWSNGFHITSLPVQYTVLTADWLLRFQGNHFKI